MQKQTSNQTIYTELDKQDYIEVSAEETQKEKKGIFTKILEIFK